MTEDRVKHRHKTRVDQLTTTMSQLIRKEASRLYDSGASTPLSTTRTVTCSHVY
jgi:hypothetical protein